MILKTSRPWVFWKSSIFRINTFLSPKKITDVMVVETVGLLFQRLQTNATLGRSSNGTITTMYLSVHTAQGMIGLTGKRFSSRQNALTLMHKAYQAWPAI